MQFRKLCRVLFTLLLTLTGSSVRNATADLVTVSFSGRINFVAELFAQQSVLSYGDTFVGSYSFETTTPGIYWTNGHGAVYNEAVYTEAVTSIEVSFSKGYTLRGCGGGYRTQIHIWDDAPVVFVRDLYGVDIYNLVGDALLGKNGKRYPPFYVSIGFENYIERTGGAAISSLSLSQPLPNPANFERASGFFAFGNDNGFNGFGFSIESFLQIPNSSGACSVCGNSRVEVGEECDDGNTVSGDGCSATCHRGFCGDGTVQSEIGEQCDDGNTGNGDGCSGTCQIEAPTPRCGDGNVDPGEQCDDGNMINTDGCTNTCKAMCLAPNGTPSTGMLKNVGNTRIACNPDTTGNIIVDWGEFGPREFLESDTGEKLEVKCMGGSRNIPSFQLFYTPKGGTPIVAGMCPFEGGCNVATFFYSGNSDGNDKPDCFISTKWLSRDFGDINDEVNDNPLHKMKENPWTRKVDVSEERLDWAWSFFNVGTKDLAKVSVKWDYAGVEVDPFPNRWVRPRPVCPSSLFAYEGGTPEYSVVDPPIGSETDAFFEEVLESLQGLSPSLAAPMELGTSVICDFDGDGSCGPADLLILQNAIGFCIGDTLYHPLADNNGDGCVTEIDQTVLLTSDIDEDGILDFDDNCPLVANPGQEDGDNDGIGNACEGRNLDSLLSNSSFETDLVHSQWTATTPNKTYKLNAPMVNPYVIPRGEVVSLKAPAGNNFIGILNPKDQDTSGKLVHTSIAGPFPAGTAFQVTVFANRGRLAGAKTALFDSSPSEVLVQFFGWGTGKLPTINSNTDNWSRQPIVKKGQAFTNWAANGQWASQTFQFVTDKDLSYLSLSIAGMNHKNASYVAFDVE